MDNEDYLGELINSGPDAQGNLYRASFVLGGNIGSSLQEGNPLKDNNHNETLWVRLTKYTSPKREVSTSSLPFQNTSIDIITPSANLDSHKLSLTFRLDDNYHLYDLLNNSIPIKENGFFNEDFKDTTVWGLISVSPLKGSNLEESKICWKYENCYLLGVPSLSYSYTNSSSLEVNCTFLYQRYSTYSE